MLFDRCPADILACLVTHDDGDSFDVDEWSERVTDAMKTLDLIVFVPVEARDRIAVPAHEDRERRMAVHDKLEELLVDDELGCDVEVLRVEGEISTRVDRVMARVEAPGRARRRRTR